MAFQLPDDMEFDLQVTDFDDQGNQVPAVFDTPPTWASTDTNIVTVEPAAGDSSGATGTIKSVPGAGHIGAASITVQGTDQAGQALNLIFDVETGVTAETGNFGFATSPLRPRS